MVSVIVPNYNHAPYLRRRLDSIFNQTYKDFEVILLDDCSTDNSLEILNECSRHTKVTHFITNKQNSGSSFKQWGKGIQASKGEYIWIAESDDYCDSSFLEKTISFLQKNECTLCFTNSYIVDEKDNKVGKYNERFALYENDFNWFGKDLIQNYFTCSNIIPNASAVLFKKVDVVSKIKNELIKFKINGDWFLWINLLMKGNCGFISEPLNFFRRHKDAGSHRNVANFNNIEEALRINIFLKNNGFKVDGKGWLRTWVAQANYNPGILLIKNFFVIYKLSFKLFPFPSSYLLYLIARFKISIIRKRLSI